MPDQNTSGAFIASSIPLDLEQIRETSVNSPEFKELIVILAQYFNDLAINTNLRDVGMYNTLELINGQQFFRTSATPGDNSLRPVYRKVIYYPTALPNAGTVAIPHNLTLTASCSFTRIYGVANNLTGGSFLPLPYASPTLANNIELSVDTTNINVTTGSNRTAYTVNYFIVEYIALP